MTDTRALVEANTKPETFDFAAAVLDRSYPEISVPIYLDEKNIKALIDITEQRNELMTRIANTQNPDVSWAERLAEIDARHDELIASLKAQEYTVNIRGVAPEQQLELEERSYIKHPAEYQESVSPITGVAVRTEIANDDRDAEFATLIRQAHLVSVVSPTGAVDADFSDIEKVRALFSRLPLLARLKIDTAINEATLTVDYYRELVDEVF